MSNPLIEDHPALSGRAELRTCIHIIDNLGAGGKERSCVEVVKMLSASGTWRVWVVSMSEGLFFTELLSLPRVQLHPLLRRSRHDPSVLWRFARLCRSSQAVLIHSWHHLATLVAIPAARALGIALVTSQFQDAPARLPWKLRWRSRLAFACVDAVVCNSRAGLRVYGAPPHKSHLIHSPYDPQRAAGDALPAPARSELCAPGRLLVGMVATFSRYKDQPLLIDAACRILARRDDVAFVLVGGGPTLAACRDRVPAALRPFIRLPGQLPCAIEAVVAHFDVGVLATFTEGISNALIEYMALGKPVVASDGGGTPELVQDGVSGWLVPAGDVDQMVERITRLLDDAALRQRMGAQGRAKVLGEFLLEHTVVKYARLYEQLLGAAPGPPPAQRAANKAS